LSPEQVRCQSNAKLETVYTANDREGLWRFGLTSDDANCGESATAAPEFRCGIDSNPSVWLDTSKRQDFCTIVMMTGELQTAPARDRVWQQVGKGRYWCANASGHVQP